MNIKKPKDYQKVIDYWAGKGPKPIPAEANSVFMELAENVKIENCIINHEVLKALFNK